MMNSKPRMGDEPGSHAERRFQGFRSQTLRRSRARGGSPQELPGRDEGGGPRCTRPRGVGSTDTCSGPLCPAPAEESCVL